MDENKEISKKVIYIASGIMVTAGMVAIKLVSIGVNRIAITLFRGI